MFRAIRFAVALAPLLFAVSAYAQPVTAPLVDPVKVAAADRIENWTGKTIMVYTPHPDDDTFSSGGTMAHLVKKGNKVIVVIYTNDDKGSKDLEMSSERLARIRRAEEEDACRILGIPTENIHWLGYRDGDLEYADPRTLRGEACRLMKIYRPDAVLSPDPGTQYVQWHKTDHRMAANITEDAFIAAEWHLYYPQHLLDEDLQPYNVPLVYYFYSQAPNYEADITDTFDLKMQAAAAHVSQFEPSNTKYVDTLPQVTIDGIRARFGEFHKTKRGYAERFRRAER
ncbi:MAG: PIG-L deacetylase family protein [Candidatus Hydrogenedentota bacterium]|mgnify:CR=1 FL=1